MTIKKTTEPDSPGWALIESVDLRTDKVVTGDGSPKPKKYINIYKQSLSKSAIIG